MGEADVLMPEKVVESLLGENGDLIQVDQMIVVVMVILNVLMLMSMLERVVTNCGNGAARDIGDNVDALADVDAWTMVEGLTRSE